MLGNLFLTPIETTDKNRTKTSPYFHEYSYLLLYSDAVVDYQNRGRLQINN